MTESERMQHAIDVHGLKQFACPSCGEVPSFSCVVCGGDGIAFVFEKPAPCGAGCPMGNPQ